MTYILMSIIVYLLIYIYSEIVDGIFTKVNHIKDALAGLLSLDNIEGKKVQKIRMGLYMVLGLGTASAIEREVLVKFAHAEKKRFLGIVTNVDIIYKVDYDKYCKELDMASLIALYKHKNKGGE